MKSLNKSDGSSILVVFKLSSIKPLGFCSTKMPQVRVGGIEQQCRPPLQMKRPTFICATYILVLYRIFHSEKKKCVFFFFFKY